MAIIFIRTLIVFATIIISMRIMGKRQLGELELSELVVAVLISDIAANPLQDIGIPLLNGIIPVLTLLGCELLISGSVAKYPRFRALVCGRPSVLIENGTIIQREMRRNRFTLDELREELRNQGIIDISKVQYAILETDGRLNTILYPAEQPVTAAQMGITADDPGYPLLIISDGNILENNLRKAGKDKKWLNQKLKKLGVTKADEVYIMTINNADQIYFSKIDQCG